MWSELSNLFAEQPDVFFQFGIHKSIHANQKTQACFIFKWIDDLNVSKTFSKTEQKNNIELFLSFFLVFPAKKDFR